MDRLGIRIDNKTILTKKNCLVFAACFVALLVVLLFVHNGSQRQCATVMAFVPPSNAPWPDQISLFSEKHGVRNILELQQTAQILGYDKPSDTWVFADTAENGSLWLGHNGRVSEVKPRGLPRGYTLINARFSSGSVYVPQICDGKLVLYVYGLDGKLQRTRVLRVPKTRVGFEYRLWMQVASNGWVSATLRRMESEYVSPEQMNSGDWNLYIFDERDHLVRKMGEIFPYFSWDGNSIAYFDTSEFDPKTKLVILNLHTGKKRSMEFSFEGLTLWERYFANDCVGWRWDSRNQWIFTAYTSDSGSYGRVHAVDISTDKPRWYKIPIIASANWCILDRYPDQTSK